MSLRMLVLAAAACAVLGCAGGPVQSSPPPGRVSKVDIALLQLGAQLSAPECEPDWRTCAPAGAAIVEVTDSTTGAIGTGDRKLSDDGSLYDVLVFRGERRRNVVIRMEATFDSYLILLRGARAIADDDDSGGADHAEIRVTLPADGWYVIAANSATASGSGSYRLSIRTDE